MSCQVLWIKDAPVIGTNTPDEVKAYINSIITCSKPDPESSQTLSSLVTKFQTHTCNKYCQKTYNHGGKFYWKCRFVFPRKVREDTVLNDVIDCLAVNQSKQPRKHLYHLKCSQQETTINDYNPALLLAISSERRRAIHCSHWLKVAVLHNGLYDET